MNIFVVLFLVWLFPTGKDQINFKRSCCNRYCSDQFLYFAIYSSNSLSLYLKWQCILGHAIVKNDNNESTNSLTFERRTAQRVSEAPLALWRQPEQLLLVHRALLRLHMKKRPTDSAATREPFFNHIRSTTCALWWSAPYFPADFLPSPFIGVYVVENYECEMKFRGQLMLY